MTSPILHVFACVMTDSLRLGLALLFGAALAFNPVQAGATEDVPPATSAPLAKPRFAFGLSPFLAVESKEQAFRSIVQFLLEEAPLGSSIAVFDAFQNRTVTRLEIPRLKAFESGKTRANQFRQPILDLKQFLASDPPRPESRGLDFTGAVRLPQFLDFVGRNLSGPDSTVIVTVIGSPLHLDPKEPGFAMAHGYFPSDGHLVATREKSVFGLQGREHTLDGVVVQWAYFGDPWASELHHEKVSRFWTLYVQRQGGRMGTFTGDLPTAFAALREPPPPSESTATASAIDPADSKVEMLRITRDVGAMDWISRDELSRPAQGPPSSTAGPMKIGIRWKGDLDLDLYARTAPEAGRLYFENPRIAEGYYFKDHRSSPDREYEFIEFLEPVDVNRVDAAINHYEGDAPGGADGEIRIEFEGRIYSDRFSLAASQGNRGREGNSQSKYWFPIDIPRLLKLR